MISNDDEYQVTLELVQNGKKRLAQARVKMKKEGYSPVEIKRAVDPLTSYYLGLAEEAADFRKKKGAPRKRRR